MGVIINPRGTSGAGKTEFARRIAAMYGWPDRGRMRPVYREGRRRPVCYLFEHSLGGRPLAVLGHYEVRSGGCDTLGAVHETFELAGRHAAGGCDVLFEGLLVSRDHHHSAIVANVHRLHVLRLTTPLDQCIRQVIMRRRARRDARPLISKRTSDEHDRIADACSRLCGCASVEALDFTAALLRARELLGLSQPRGSSAGRWFHEPLTIARDPLAGCA
jgi:hypothetical protein